MSSQEGGGKRPRNQSTEKLFIESLIRWTVNVKWHSDGHNRYGGVENDNRSMSLIYSLLLAPWEEVTFSELNDRQYDGTKYCDVCVFTLAEQQRSLAHSKLDPSFIGRVLPVRHKTRTSFHSSNWRMLDGPFWSTLRFIVSDCSPKNHSWNLWN